MLRFKRPQQPHAGLYYRLETLTVARDTVSIQNPNQGHYAQGTRSHVTQARHL